MSGAVPERFGEVRPHLRAAHLGGIAPDVHDRLARTIVAGRMSAAQDVHDTLLGVRADAAALAAAANAPRTESYPIVKRMLDGSATRHHVFEHTLKPVWEASKKLANDWSNGKVDSAAIPERAEQVARIAGEVLESSPAMKALREIKAEGPSTGEDLRGRSDAAAAELSSRLRLHRFLTRLETDARALAVKDHKGMGERELLGSRAQDLSYSFIKEELPRYAALDEIKSAVSHVPVGLAMRTMTVEDARRAYVGVADLANKALRDGPPQEAFGHEIRTAPILPTKGPRTAETPVPARGRDAGR